MTDSELAERTQHLCAQLINYGGVFNPELLALLQSVAYLNETLWNDHDAEFVRAEISEARAALDAIESTLAKP